MCFTLFSFGCVFLLSVVTNKHVISALSLSRSNSKHMQYCLKLCSLQINDISESICSCCTWHTALQYMNQRQQKWWWRLRMETVSALLALCAGKSPVTGEIPITKVCGAELWWFLWSVPWINSWINHRDAGDLIRHHAPYDVIVMKMHFIRFFCMVGREVS